MPDVQLRLVNQAGHPNRWAARLKIARTSLNMEAYGETAVHALVSLAEGLTTADLVLLRMRAEHEVDEARRARDFSMERPPPYPADDEGKP